jgi:hypothetical protein
LANGRFYQTAPPVVPQLFVAADILDNSCQNPLLNSGGRETSMAHSLVPPRILAVLLMPLAFMALAVRASAQSPPRDTSAKADAPHGVEFVVHGGYPELHVDGEPFFIHSAAFFYYRIPRDLWSISLDRYRTLGINTIDIYIPWNWHETAEGTFDFDGHTNPRRNLRALLKLIADKNLRLIARPGPLIMNEWRWGGYPGWLLERPEYAASNPMDDIDLLEGRYPPLAALNTHDAEAAAKGWLDNPIHMAATKKWLEAVAQELAPYVPGKAVNAEPESGHLKTQPPGPPNSPLLFVQLDDDVGEGRTNNIGPDFWRYMTSLRDMLRSGGLNVPVFINPTDMRVAASGSALREPVGVMGQWYMRPDAQTQTTVRSLTSEDAATIEFFTEELKTQPLFPPALIEYQAGWYAPADDDRAAENPPSNTLESSRLFLGNGLHGISYCPLQDTLTPATYSVPWANQAYLWGAALDTNGRPQRRSDAVKRNGDVMKQWGKQLAASHKRADFGLVYPIGAYSQTALATPDILRISGAVQKIERLAQLDHLASELLDPQYQSVDQLLRDPLVFLPALDSLGTQFQLSEKAQQNLVDYVRRGGTLFVFPSRPLGNAIAQLWSEAPTERAVPSEVISASWKFGAGRVIESSKDFYSWINLKESFEENRAHEVAAWSIQAVEAILTEAKIQPAIRVAGNPPSASNLIITEIVSNEGTGSLGARTSGQGWISVTNLDSDATIDAPLTVLLPMSSSAGGAAQTTVIPVTVPPKESLLLPLFIPICDEVPDPAACKDAVTASGAEYLGAVREGKALELNFYAPAKSEIRLRLDHVPSHISLQDATIENKWDPLTQEMTLTIPRGASPNFSRQLKLQMPYVPRAPAAAQAGSNPLSDFELSVANAVRLPLGQSTYFAPFPPLVVLDDPRSMRVVFQETNPSFSKQVELLDVGVTGAFRGSASLRMTPGLDSVTDMMLKPSNGQAGSGKAFKPDPDGLVHGTVELRGGHEHDEMPISFLTLREGGVTPYRFDFDGDGSDEWVLENSRLRLIVSPKSGGHVLALVAKDSAADLFSSVGGVRDNFSFTPNPPGISPERERGRYGLFNRTYVPEWIGDDKNMAIRLRYHAPDVFPSGATIEKTLSLDGTDSFHVSYTVTLDKPADSGAADGGKAKPVGNEAQPQSFVAVNSIPAIEDSVRVTRICWTYAQEPAAASAAAPQKSPANESEHTQMHCEEFVPGGATIEIPADAKGLELRTPGRPGLALDWDSGKMSVEPKRYSVLLKLQSRALAPGVELKMAMTFHVLAAD